MDAQRSACGDGLEAERVRLYAWASGPHFDRIPSFCDFPCLIGPLPGIDHSAAYRAAPDMFDYPYDGLLRRTGQADPADLAVAFRVDIRDQAFRRRSLDSLQAAIATLAAVVDRRAQSTA